MADMSQDNADKVQVDIAVKVTYTGIDIKPTFPAITVPSSTIVAGDTRSKKRVQLAAAFAAMPADQGCGKVSQLTDAQLPDPPKDMLLTLMQVRLSPNQKPAKPVWLSTRAFQPATKADLAIKLDGTADVTFWDSATFDSLFQSKITALPQDGQLYWFHENTDPVYIDIVVLYRPKPAAKEAAVAAAAGEPAVQGAKADARVPAAPQAAKSQTTHGPAH